MSDRIRAIEDRLEIYNLIAGHPPSADTGADYYAETVYAEDGVFDRGEDLTGAAGGKKIAAMLQSPGHQAAISGGLAHFAGLPHIALNGDTATVTSYLQIIHPHPTAEEIELVNHGTSRGIESTGWWPLAGNSFAPARAGGLSAAPCDRSTAPNPPAPC